MDRMTMTSNEQKVNGVYNVNYSVNNVNCVNSINSVHGVNSVNSANFTAYKR